MLIAAAVVTAAVAALAGSGSSRGSIGRPSQRVSYPLDDSAETRAILELRAQALAEGNAIWLAAHPDAPCCAGCAEVKYVPPSDCDLDGSCQDIQDAAALIGSQVGTCIEIAAYDAGNLMVDGQDAQVRLVENGPFDYHAVIEMPDGSILDPTAELQAEGCSGGCGV